MDEVFGARPILVNEIIWKRATAHGNVATLRPL